MRSFIKRFLTAAAVCMMFGVAIAGPADAKGTRAQHVAKVEKQINQLEKQERKAVTAIEFFKNSDRRWMLHLRYSHLPCWEVPLKGPEKLCAISRGAVRVNTRRLAELRVRIARLEEQLLYVGNERHWQCIHRYERHPRQGWSTRTGNGYYGGLQMDISFQSTYGPYVLGFPDAKTMFQVKGTADRWTPREQMAVAQYAKDSGRGYYPWPNTARYCNLI